MSAREHRRDRPPEIEVGARVSARKLRFRRKPETDVEFKGRTRARSDDRIDEVELETESRSERRNLPERVEPGVTYRDVELGWAAQARAALPEEEGDSED